MGESRRKTQSRDGLVSLRKGMHAKESNFVVFFIFSVKLRAVNTGDCWVMAAIKSAIRDPGHWKTRPFCTPCGYSIIWWVGDCYWHQILEDGDPYLVYKDYHCASALTTPTNHKSGTQFSYIRKFGKLQLRAQESCNIFKTKRTGNI